jgi:hypothetical protein
MPIKDLPVWEQGVDVMLIYINGVLLIQGAGVLL